MQQKLFIIVTNILTKQIMKFYKINGLRKLKSTEMQMQIDDHTRNNNRTLFSAQSSRKDKLAI